MAKKNNKKTNRQKNTFSILLKILLGVFLLLLMLSIFKTCRDCDEISNRKIVARTGYLPDDEDWDNIPDVVPPYDDDELDSLPDKVSLEAFFPPIGYQDTFGTCVAWSTGYNLKTALNAIDNNWTPEQLANPSNQISPKDLWMGVPSEKKGMYCKGTTFEPVFNVLMTKGVSSMAKVPYSKMGTCNGSFVGDTINKIASFNHVVSEGSLPSVKQIKAYINDTVPLVFAAEVGDVFQKWHSNQVFNLSDNGKKGGHAMVISGYDDSKHAFRVRNSWGIMWGDNGSAWVDYDFFMNDFCIEVFIASNK